MSYAQVSAAITALKVKGSSKGVSRAAIKASLSNVTAARINLALARAVKAGTISQVIFHSISFTGLGDIEVGLQCSAARLLASGTVVDLYVYHSCAAPFERLLGAAIPRARLTIV